MILIEHDIERNCRSVSFAADNLDPFSISYIEVTSFLH